MSVVWDDDLPLQHVLRPALPWRSAVLTECGREPGEDVITRADLVAKVRRQGKKRAVMTTCVTCFETAQRWPEWDHNPVAALAREVQKVTYWGGEQTGPLRDELVALATLVDRHREEFETILSGLADTVRLDEHRRRARQRGARRAR